VHRVTANCFLDDTTSWSLMERVGMRRELQGVRESLHRSGQWLDTVGYAILEDEWPPGSGPNPGSSGSVTVPFRTFRSGKTSRSGRSK
jgi:hypothetical protein